MIKYFGVQSEALVNRATKLRFELQQALKLMVKYLLIVTWIIISQKNIFPL